MTGTHGGRKWDTLEIKTTEEKILPYHNKGGKRGQYISSETRRFIGWDGEGMDIDGERKPQSYVLFGCSTGQHIKNTGGLHIDEILEFMMKIKEENPSAWHIGFVFDYDVNMIVKQLSVKRIKYLKENGMVRYRSLDGKNYLLTYTPKKWFTVTRYEKGYHPKKNNNARTTIRIEDVFSFYTESFIATLDRYGIEHPAVLSEGKDLRGVCPNKCEHNNVNECMDYILSYWKVEIKLLEDLISKFRDLLYKTGFKITRWYGPGVIASYVLKQHNIKAHMAESPPEVLDAATYAYAAGRFELFTVGRYVGNIWSADINSAYPYAISKLPSLANGIWEKVDKPTGRTMFALYHVKYGTGAATSRTPQPLFFRDIHGHISFPPTLEGWYWAPEVLVTQQFKGDKLEILEGWEFIENDKNLRPFSFILDMYKKRQELKRLKDPAQQTVKLGMNSIYGKLAQRVGWDPVKKRIPPFHQIEWAGWVTSYTRAKIASLTMKAPMNTNSIETDGAYFNINPELLGIKDSKELGGWEIEKYDEMCYLQSGVAILRKDDKWTVKVRGLDKKKFTVQSVLDYIATLQPLKEKGEIWQPYLGETTRFIGMAQALQSSIPMKLIHGVWKTDVREIFLGSGKAEGKRIHSPTQCIACKEGVSPNDGLHDLIVRSNVAVQWSMGLGIMSHRHFIPWLHDKEEKPEWMNTEKEYLYAELADKPERSREEKR